MALEWLVSVAVVKDVHTVTVSVRVRNCGIPFVTFALYTGVVGEGLGEC